VGCIRQAPAGLISTALPFIYGLRDYTCESPC
jgi:hypothetical protein